MGYVSTCRLLNSHSTEYIASGICVHLQIINIAIQLNTLQVGYVVHLQIIVWFRFNRLVDNHPLTYYSHSIEYLQMGYVSTCRLLNSHSTEYIASGICVHLEIINIAIQLNTLQVGYVSTCSLLYGSGLIGWWTIIPLTYYSHSTEYIASGICLHLQILT